MKATLASITLVLLASCRDGTRLVKVTKCGMPCYTWKIGQPDVGQCKSGTWSCIDDDEENAECVGQAGPSRELCDGIDNNCDRRVDEGATAFCINECGIGQATCVDGKAGQCNAPTPSPEVCDGIDNDCDGLIDEPQDLPVEFCYTGPAGSASYGSCHPGSTRCEFGKKVCYGESVPVAEQCNGVDDNCDGRIDEGVVQANPADIVFVMDNSHSMQPTIDSVQGSVNTFSTTYSNRADLRWGLVVTPDKDPRYDGQARRYMDFNTAGALGAAMRSQMATGGGREATLDALAELMDTSNPLNMSWRPNSRHIMILFTDEVPQSFSSPLNTTDSVKDQLFANPNTDIWIFTEQEFAWRPIFGYGYIPGSGIRYLSTDPDNILRDLNTIIKDSTCK